MNQNQAAEQLPDFLGNVVSSKVIASSLSSGKIGGVVVFGTDLNNNPTNGDGVIRLIFEYKQVSVGQ